MHSLNIIKHPHNAASVVSWALLEWHATPDAELLVVTNKGDGKPLINRFRVKLSSARKALAKMGIATQSFTINTTMIEWTDEHGVQYEAVTFTRVVELRHRINMSVQDLNLESSNG